MTRGRTCGLAFYGDDFTGSTDALEILARAGLSVVLFLRVPDRGLLAAFPDAEAIGIAGVTRSLGPEEMESALHPAFSFFRELRPRHVHYKVCSTFDSSPATGSIGKAMDIAAAYFPARYIPLVGGTPGLGRYCVFGNLYARMGTGGTGAVYRLDRHPSMSRHPVTPATESDLREVIGRQTRKRIVLFDLFQCRLPADQAQAALEALIGAGPAPIVLFDALTEDDLRVPGMLMEASVPDDGPLFSAGPSAVETALVQAWGLRPPRPAAAAEQALPHGGPVVVLAGSCSPVTTGQIQTAVESGFADIPLDAAAILGGAGGSIAGQAVEAAASQLLQGRSVIVHTDAGRSPVRDACPRLLGGTLGTIGRELLSRTPVRRLIVAGGDTSGHVAGALGVQAVTVSQSFVRGAPFCRMHAPGTPLDGKEINFKGGQVGQPDYFIKAAIHSQPRPHP